MAQFIKKKRGWGVRFYIENMNGEKERIYLSPYPSKPEAEKAMIEFLKNLDKTKLIIKDIGFTKANSYITFFKIFFKKGLKSIVLTLSFLISLIIFNYYQVYFRHTLGTK